MTESAVSSLNCNYNMSSQASRALRRLPILRRPLISAGVCRALPSRIFAQGLRIDRLIHSTRVRRDRSFTNFLADDNPPAVQVSSISENGIQLADGLVIPGACIFLEGKVFLWDVPTMSLTSQVRDERWKGWNEERFQLFEVVTPRPGEFLPCNECDV